MKNKQINLLNEKKFNDDVIDTLKYNVLHMSSRSRGERTIQHIGCVVNGDGYKTGNQLYDAHRGTLRVEYKSAIPVEKKKYIHYNGSPIFDKVMSYSDERYLSTSNSTTNFQNIKPDCFDILNYSIFDENGLHMFEITSKELIEKVNDGSFPHYSQFHGSKETGNGQFVVTEDSLDFHSQYYKGSISWNTIANALQREVTE